jgi:hypothetical protein
VWDGLWAFDVAPSPKAHDQLVTPLEERSRKSTARGTVPVSGVPEKSAFVDPEPFELPEPLLPLEQATRRPALASETTNRAVRVCLMVFSRALEFRTGGV